MHKLRYDLLELSKFILRPDQLFDILIKFFHIVISPLGNGDRFIFSTRFRIINEQFFVEFFSRAQSRKLYVDNGSAFRSKQLMHAMASLAIALIHSRPYKPQGRGKIERFFKSVRSQFLPGFTGATIEEINAGFEEWLAHEYNDRRHSATGKKPLERFTDGIECIRSTPDNLKDHFRKTVRRRVNKDRTIILDKRLYQGPVALIGKQVELLFHEGEYDRVELKYQNKSFGFINQVDLNVNCRVKRDKNNNPVISVEKATAESGQMWGGKL